MKINLTFIADVPFILVYFARPILLFSIFPSLLLSGSEVLVYDLHK